MNERTDAELRELMRALSRANGLPLDDGRIEAALPAYRGFLKAIDSFDRMALDPDEVPAHRFELRSGEE